MRFGWIAAAAACVMAMPAGAATVLIGGATQQGTTVAEPEIFDGNLVTIRLRTTNPTTFQFSFVVSYEYDIFDRATGDQVNGNEYEYGAFNPAGEPALRSEYTFYIGPLREFLPDNLIQLNYYDLRSARLEIYDPIGGGGYEAWISSAVVGVPEPATWATMIAGIGTAGGALRRRRQRRDGSFIPA